MSGNPTRRHLYELIGESRLTLSQHRLVLKRDGDEPDESPQQLTQWLVPATFESLPHEEILVGIANHEQGRTPSIGQDVFIICPQSDIVFHMYDDRGCIVFSDAPSKLSHLYVKYNAWLVDYWRESIDSVFRDTR